jgi:hypothetical protein
MPEKTTIVDPASPAHRPPQPPAASATNTGGFFSFVVHEQKGEQLCQIYLHDSDHPIGPPLPRILAEAIVRLRNQLPQTDQIPKISPTSPDLFATYPTSGKRHWEI